MDDFEAALAAGYESCADGRCGDCDHLRCWPRRRERDRRGRHGSRARDAADAAYEAEILRQIDEDIENERRERELFAAAAE